MLTSTNSPTRLTKSRTALLALGCSFALALLAMPAVHATDSVALQPLADKAPGLPLTATFEKKAGAEGAPYVLHLKNESKASVKVAGQVLLSVSFHAVDKARKIAAHVVEAGAVWTITDLSANDKVILTADGFSPLELTVP